MMHLFLQQKFDKLREKIKDEDILQLLEGVITETEFALNNNNGEISRLQEDIVAKDIVIKILVKYINEK